MLYRVLRTLFIQYLAFALVACIYVPAQPPVIKPTLSGFTSLPADTFAAGMNAGKNNGKGQAIAANGRQAPFTGQPVQGFSGVQFGADKSRLLFLSDNGFGVKANSADYLLRLYKIDPAFSTGLPVVEGFIPLADPEHLIPFDIINKNTEARLLTGADFDPESFVIDRKGIIWVGDEFGPYILPFDRTGKLLTTPIATPDIVNGEIDYTQNVTSPDSPELNNITPNLRRSRGFEGMAISPNKKIAYPMLEGTVKGDPEGSLRIYKFSTESKTFTDFVGFYLLAGNHAIGDFTAINKHQFLVIERDHKQGEAAQFKKVFLIDINNKNAQGFVNKIEVVDLLNIDDPDDINRDGKTVFTFPFITIENILVLDKHTILIANDNNYPFSKGRAGDIDNNEIIKITLPYTLKLDRRLLK